MQCQPWVFHNVLLILWRNISCILVYSHGIHEQLFKTREWPRAGVWLVRASGRSLYLVHFLCHNFPRWFSLAVLQLLGDSLTIKLPPPKMSLSSVTLKMHLSYFPEAKIRGKCAFATRLKLKKEKKRKTYFLFPIRSLVEDDDAHMKVALGYGDMGISAHLQASKTGNTRFFTSNTHSSVVLQVRVQKHRENKV